jgi:glycosyltransferase involved in cell wall biosynthesis
VASILPELNNTTKLGALRRLERGRWVLSTMACLHRYLKKCSPHHVLTHFGEYLSPIWAPQFQRLRRCGFMFHTVLHDPKRDYRVGPAAFHRLSVRTAFDLNVSVFVHGYDRGDTPCGIAVSQVPYGVHDVTPPTKPRDEVRRLIGIPDKARLITAYGYIRDNKNLDLLIEAIAQSADVFLVVAGSEMQGGNKPASFYGDLSNEEAANLIAGSDYLALTYSASFVSSSAALGVGVAYRVPALISSGSAATRDLVERYKIGIWVEPDSVDAIRDALRAARLNPPVPDWDGYCRDNSWTRNAEIILQRMRSLEAAGLAANPSAEAALRVSTRTSCDGSRGGAGNQ